MAEPTLQEKIYSNDYFDAVVPLSVTSEDFLEEYSGLDPQLLCARYGMVHIPMGRSILPEGIGYSQTPKLYTLLDTTSLESAGILRVQAQPSLGYRGENVLLGFIDTGIDYTLDAFRNPDGSSRILGIWDQTEPSEKPPYDTGYGTGYTNEEINRALFLEDPYSVVPQRDANGHGTFLAGVAAGSADIPSGFTGAAPGCSIAMVKLKPAKQNLRDYFLIRDDALAYQETDIMMGMRYLLFLSQTYELPLVFCLGLGTNQGDHSGNSPLERELTYVLDYLGCFSSIAAGNETGRGHHYYQSQTDDSMPAVEILVDETTSGLFVEIWSDSPDLYGVSVVSPLGENIPRVPPRLGTSSSYSFVAERTVLQVTYEIAEYTSGAQLTILRFTNPTPGIWRVYVSGNSPMPLGSYHIWLPVTGFISPGTVFLNPTPYTTLTPPSTAESVISVANYDAYSNSLAINSGRGYTRTGIVKPDFAAPGVDVFGPAVNPNSALPPLNRYTRRSGTSVSAALAAGAIALLLNWNADQPAPQILTNRAVKDYLTRGALRQEGVRYPNREWGYGTLNLYNVFRTLM